MLHVINVMFVLMICMTKLAEAQMLFHPANEPRHRTGALYAPDLIDPLYCFFHPALIPDSILKSLAAFAEKKYLLDDVFLTTAATSIRIKQDAVTVGYSRFQGGLYRQQLLAVGFAKNLGKANAGIRVGYLTSRAGSQRIISGIHTSIGAILKLSPNVFSSFKLDNVHSIFFPTDSSEIRQASRYQLGLGTRLSRFVYLGVETTKAEERPPDLLVLLTWSVTGRVFIRSAWQVHTSQPWLSFAWKMNDWILESNISYHSVLGISPGFAIVFALKNSRR